MKSKEELNAIKEEVASVNEKIRELSPEELEQVTVGVKAERRMDTVSVAAGYQTVTQEASIFRAR